VGVRRDCNLIVICGAMLFGTMGKRIDTKQSFHPPKNPSLVKRRWKMPTRTSSCPPYGPYSLLITSDETSPSPDEVQNLNSSIISYHRYSAYILCIFMCALVGTHVTFYSLITYYRNNIFEIVKSPLSYEPLSLYYYINDTKSSIEISARIVE
jgi:hypothetical protein